MAKQDEPDRTTVETSNLTGVSPRRNYRRLAVISILAISLVSITPLVAMALVNYRQYHAAMTEESTRPVRRLTASAARTLEFFLSERQAALQFVVSEIRLETLVAEGEIERVLASLKVAFGGFVDLEVIDSTGSQTAYSGPFELSKQSYREEDWYEEVLVRGIYTSQVFMGHRNLPHFVIAIHHAGGESFVLRATVDTETLDRQIAGAGVGRSDELYVIDHHGVLQTPSRSHGQALSRVPFEVPAYSLEARTMEITAAGRNRMLIGYAYVRNSPFILIHESSAHDLTARWTTLRRNLALFVTGSVALILAVVVWGVLVMLRRVRDSDRRHAALLHRVEYTNKMAAIGRLASGVAHEVNNPLAIISEKAGLIEDVMEESGGTPEPEFLLRQIRSILRSVDRCAEITHRLLGFAKHVDVRQETIEIPAIISDVYGFLEREARYRNIDVTFRHEESLPPIVSDRGQLQQVVLNILNNAIAAVDDGGRIEIRTESKPSGEIVVHIEDNGAGISKGDLQHIFEPFFTTKGSAGTGLGLSITYGIVEKLGGKIMVESELGRGTTFTVVLPAKGPGAAREEEKS